jgi:hypothetical protein
MIVFKTLKLCRNLKTLFQPLSLALFVNGMIIKPIKASIDAVTAIQISRVENQR